MSVRHFRNHKVIYAAVTAVAVALFLTLAVTQNPIRQYVTERLHAAVLSRFLDENRWRSLIRADGGHKAYEEFSRAVAPLTAYEQHTAAHVFGDALYTEMGLQGLGVCDQNFFGGCYHQFMGKAFADQGLGILPQIVSVCLSQSGPRIIVCAHGVGHGLVTAEGYQRPNLTTELDGCDSFPINFRTACYEGVFMEYVERTVLGPDAGFAPFKGDWYEPCDSLSGMKKSMCLFHQPEWWWYLYEQQGYSQEDTIKKIADLCEKAGVDTLVDMCFSGMGNTFGFRLESAAAAQACIESSTDTQRTALCEGSLARREKIGGDPTMKACSYVSDALRTICEKYVASPTLPTDNFSRFTD